MVAVAAAVFVAAAPVVAVVAVVCACAVADQKVDPIKTAARLASEHAREKFIVPISSLPLLCAAVHRGRRQHEFTDNYLASIVLKCEVILTSAAAMNFVGGENNMISSELFRFIHPAKCGAITPADTLTRRVIALIKT